MARHCSLLAVLLLIIACGIDCTWSLKCRADDEVTFDEDYRDAVRVCMANITNERDEQGYRPEDSGGGSSGGGGNRRQRPKGDSNGGGGNRRPGRPNRGGACDSGSYGNNGDRYGNNGGYGGNNGGHSGGYGGNGGHNYNNNDGYGGNSGGGYGGGGGYYGYGGGPNRRGPMPVGGTAMQGGPMGGGSMAGGAMVGGSMAGGPMAGVPMAGRPLTLRSPNGYSGSHDGRLGSALENVDACIIHCIFRQMLMLNENARPDKGAIINIMTQKVHDRELRDFILESIEECFDYSKAEATRSLYKCDFSKKLALCMEEKARRHCDDWDDDTRGDQQGNRPNNQRPPRQHYVGR